jgi:MerR family transcriptional regulator, heat shock protein HspR
MQRYLKVVDVVAEFHVDATFLHHLADEQVIQVKRSSEGDEVISSEDVERVRVVHTLTEELEVNLPGVEVILHMRDTMLAMQQQFSEILRTLAEEMRRRKADE